MISISGCQCQRKEPDAGYLRGRQPCADRGPAERRHQISLFVGIKVGRTSLSKVMPYMLMYYVAIIGGLLLVTFIPAVSTALPQAMGLM